MNPLSKTNRAAPTQSLNELMQQPPWLQALRKAMGESIKADDISAIMQAQVNKAKEGDARAAKFVLDQAHKMMASDASRPVSIVQNNFYDGERPDTSTAADPTSAERLRKMRARHAAGMPLTNPLDGPKRLTDEEERELRHLEDEEAAQAEVHVPELDAVNALLNGRTVKA